MFIPLLMASIPVRVENIMAKKIMKTCGIKINIGTTPL